MNQIIPLLAWRYLRGTNQEKNISIMVKVCFLGILIGTFSLALILFIMHGFEHVTHEKLRGIHAQIIIKASGDELNVEQLKKVLSTEFPEVVATSPSTVKQAIINSDASDDITNVIALKGIDPEAEADLNVIEQKITHSMLKEKTLSALLTKKNVLIGDSLAQSLDVQPGDTIMLLYTNDDDAKGRKVKFKQFKAVVSGTFTTGIEDFDNGLIFTSLDTLEKMFPDSGVTQLNLKLTNEADEEDVAERLRKRLGIEVASWKELYPALVSALKLEKYAMFFILALITLVACTNVISLEFMHILQKRGDIAILKAMGMHDSTIRSIFLIVGMSISLFGSVVGLILAGISGLLLERYPFISLPDAYYVTHLPAKMEWYLFALVFGVVMTLSFIATWIPALSIRKISIASILRSEA